LRGPRRGHYDPMTIGASIFLIALGAILKYAVDVTVSGIEIQTIGLILMIAGVVGLVIGLFLLTQTERRRPVAYEERDPVVR
jgi:membrane-bound ClpP family serine protease